MPVRSRCTPAGRQRAHKRRWARMNSLPTRPRNTRLICFPSVIYNTSLSRHLSNILFKPTPQTACSRGSRGTYTYTRAFNKPDARQTETNSTSITPKCPPSGSDVGLCHVSLRALAPPPADDERVRPAGANWRGPWVGSRSSRLARLPLGVVSCSAHEQAFPIFCHFGRTGAQTKRQQG